MGAVRGALVGALSLIALEAVLRNADSASSLISSITGTGDLSHPGLADRILSPEVPLIPDHRRHKDSQSTVSKILMGPSDARLVHLPFGISPF